MVIPGAAGSSNDAIARQIAKLAEEELDVSIVVQNYGTEAQGLTTLKEAEPDGYTIGLAPAAALTLFPLTQDTGYGIADTDFDVIAQTDVSPIVLLARADSELSDLGAYVEAAQGDPVVKVGGPSGRGIPALNIAQLASAADAPNYEYVGFPPGEQVAALLNGTVDVTLAQTPLASQYVSSGDMRVLGMFSSETVAGMDAPLVEDEGYDVTLAPTRVVLAPKGTPESIVEELSGIVEQAVTSDTFQQFAADSMFRTAYLDSEAATQGIQDQFAVVEPVVEQLGWGDQ
ncbi:tripartite tricarboxylate transporter substrate-binding protein [Jiangella asiatica]|nr:tripartite tricarboxylate transporter substrate-binding protein [Jiangella asiatica]